MARITNIDELMKLEPGSEVFKVDEKAQIHGYKVVGAYPAKSLKSLVVTCGTNAGCTICIGQSSLQYGFVSTDYLSAIRRALQICERNTENFLSVYGKYLKLQNDGQGNIRPEWIDRNVELPGDDETVLWTHFPVCDTTMEFASMNQTDWNDIDFRDSYAGDGRPWLTHWRRITNSFYYTEK